MAKREKREKLKAHRRAVGLSQRTLAERIGVNINTVRGWEQGKTEPYPRQHEPLRSALGISQAELVRLLDPSTPVELNGHKVPTWLNTYESLVLEAGRLEMVVRSAIPAMLQTKDYATGVERSGPGSTNDQVSERVRVRLARQSILERESNWLHLVTVLHEGVLHDVVGSPDVMASQLDHLLTMAKRPNVQVLLLPSDGRAMFCPGEFELLTKRGDIEPFMAVTFDPAGADYHERDAQPFITMFGQVQAVALPPSESARRIEAIQESYR
jgi:hypothetical protein